MTRTDPQTEARRQALSELHPEGLLDLHAAARILLRDRALPGPALAEQLDDLACDIDCAIEDRAMNAARTGSTRP